MFDYFLPIPDAESLPFYSLVLKLVVCVTVCGSHMGATPSGTTENLHFLPISCPKRIRRTRAGARGHQLQAGTHPLAQPPFCLRKQRATNKKIAFVPGFWYLSCQ